MYESRFWNAVSNVVIWVIRMFEVSFLWMLFSVVGLVVLGVGPATAASCVVTRKFVLGQTEIRVFRTFLSAYRTDFWRANKLAWILMAVGVVLAWDTKIAVDAHTMALHLALIPIVLVDVVFTAIALYVFPLYAHRNIPRLVHYFRVALVTAVFNPARSLIMLAALYVWLFVLGGLLPFLGVGLLIYVLMRLSMSGIDRVVQSLDAKAQSNPVDRLQTGTEP